jgi:phenylalanine ammonia-lyase
MTYTDLPMTYTDLSPARPTSVNSVQLDGCSLQITDAVSVGRDLVPVGVASSARDRIEASRQLMVQMIARDIPIYGVTTGFGDSAHRQISATKVAALQQNMIRFLGCGTGPIATSEVTRTAMTLRANCLAKGHSGIRHELLDRLLLMLNADVVPQIPERGSCGASGDLIPLSYIARMLTGEVAVLHAGKVRPAKEVLAELGLEPLKLEAKEGLAITNGTSFTSAFACLAVDNAQRLADISDVLTALSCEALLGNRGHFNAFLFDEAKPHPGIVHSAANIRRILERSELALDNEEHFAAHPTDVHFVELHRQVQDRYSIRCAPHITGVLRDTLSWCVQWLTVEINASDDNPLFDVGSGRVQSGGNFYAGHVGQAMDSLKVAVASLCDLMDRQLQLLVDEKFSMGLTPNLIPRMAHDHMEAGLHHGFKGMQLCCSAMTAEALKLSNPATIHSRSTEAHNQDKVSMGTIAARDARTIVEIAEAVAAIHLIAVVQAIELRGVERAGTVAQEVHALVRERVPTLGKDRVFDGDIQAMIELMRGTRMREIASLG